MASFAENRDIGSLVERVLGTGESPFTRRPTSFGIGRSSTRITRTSIGQIAASIYGNAGLARSALSRMTAEAVAETVARRAIDPYKSSPLSAEVVTLIVGSGSAEFGDESRPALLLLDPNLPPGFSPQRVSLASLIGTVPGFSLTPLVDDGLEEYFSKLARTPSTSPEQRAHADLVAAAVQAGQYERAELFAATAPEAVLARHPEMMMVGCTSPALKVECAVGGGSVQSSSAGIFCRDTDKVVGVTACHHGTGPVGTTVTLAGLPTTVKHADKVQDIVFLPLPEDYAVPTLALGRNGIRTDRAPAESDRVRFDGLTSGAVSTVVSSYSKGLLWRDALSQNKVQTPAVVNHGDSGSALIDEDDRVLGFAFRRTQYGEPIEFAEWIWGANALAALDVKPI